MKTEHVTKVWEFYRDNCAGYKEPMRKRLRELDSYVDHLESLADDGEKAAEDNERLRLEVEQLEEERDEHFRRYDELEAENTRLRETMSEITEMSIMSSRPLKNALERSRAENAKLREVIDDITEVVEASDPALVQFIAKRMERAGIEVES